MRMGDTPRLLAALAVGLFSTGCDSGGGGTADTVVATDTVTGDTGVPEPLTVTARTPAPTSSPGAHALITVTFDRPVDAASVGDETLILADAGAAISGISTVEGAVLTFQPNSVISSQTTYTATVAAGVLALDGGALADPVSWEFTTGSALSVVSVEPLSGATNVHVFDPVRVVFDKPILSSSVNADTFEVRSTGWVDGVFYDFEALPGNIRVIDDAGITGDEGRMIQWYPSGTGMPEYGVRHDIMVSRGLQSADGAALDAPYKSSFTTYVLDPGYNYELRLEGFGDSWALGLAGDVPRMTQNMNDPTLDWYVVALNDGKSYGLWNTSTMKALTERGTAVEANTGDWAGVRNQAFKLDSYGGRPGSGGPYESSGVYYIQSNNQDVGTCLKQETVGSQSGLFVRDQGGHIDSLWYFTRTTRR